MSKDLGSFPADLLTLVQEWESLFRYPLRRGAWGFAFAIGSVVVAGKQGGPLRATVLQGIWRGKWRIVVGN